MPTRIIQVDAFTDRPFAGNPAAVCLLERPAEEPWLQAVAREMNLSETAFLHPEAGGHRLRWFTPAVEVDLCGHATLASAHVLWEDGHLDPDRPARFLTRSGPLSAVRRGSEIEMDFPARPPEAAPVPPGLPEALGAEVEWVGLNGMDCLAVLASEAEVRGLAPDLTRLAAVPVRGVIATAPSADPAFDFVSRFFAPNAGVPEDPVTGSAHCALGPYWGERLGKSELVGFQASARGGVVGVGLRGSRVLLRGRAVTVLRAELLDS
jgi:predicted PhzF superfamily epimerase YddE/YHI9